MLVIDKAPCRPRSSTWLVEDNPPRARSGSREMAGLSRAFYTSQDPFGGDGVRLAWLNERGRPGGLPYNGRGGPLDLVRRAVAPLAHASEFGDAYTWCSC